MKLFRGLIASFVLVPACGGIPTDLDAAHDVTTAPRDVSIDGLAAPDATVDALAPPDATSDGFDVVVSDIAVDTRDVAAADDAITGSDVAADRVSPVDARADVAMDPCDAIAPVADAATNRTTIQHCLDSAHRAYLRAGTFAVDTQIQVNGAILAAQNATGARPIVRLTVRDGAYSLVGVGANSQVMHLAFDGNDNLRAGPVTAVLALGGDHSTVDDVAAYNSAMPPVGNHTVGVYFVCANCTDTVVRRSDIYQNHYGVIFRDTLTSANQNTLENSRIHDSKCDAITLAGYGRVMGNTIYDNGWNCENGSPPIPGASIYALQNTHGALIDGNTAYNSCGLGFDIDRCAGFTITHNTVRDPGYQFGGRYAYCGAPAAVFVLDVRDFTIDGNTFTNIDHPQNRLGVGNDPNHVFSPNGAPTFADLPSGGNQTIAFILGRRRGTADLVTGNHVTNNAMRSACASGCTGMGYFASRGTGYGAGNAWGANTTNYFTGNNPFGSNIGSHRCGGNWYAGNSTCNDGSPAPCNTDDYQHNPPVGNMYRNDPCAFFQ